MTEQDQILIEKYLNDELPVMQLKTFEQRLQNESDLLKATFIDRVIEFSIRPHPLMKTKNIIKKLGDNLLYEGSRKNSPPNTYSTEELFTIFQPLKHLERVTVTRNSNSLSKNTLQKLVVLPENGVDVVNQKLQFDLRDKTRSLFKLEVLNNREKNVLTNLISINTYSFEISLENIKPGRYYWRLYIESNNRKLKKELGTATGYFFIHKSLMPLHAV